MSIDPPGPSDARTPGRWAGPEATPPLPPAVRRYLAAEVGEARPWPAQSPVLSVVPSPTLDAGFLSEIRAIVGPEHVAVTAAERWHSARGASYSDYVRQRAGDISGLPQVVVAPADHAQAQGIVTACSQAGVAMVPAGGGTSVVGGLACPGAHISVSTHRMRSVLGIDAESGTVHVGAGITGPELEPLLASRSLTLGHLPQSWHRASIGGYLATRSAGQASTGYGRSDDMVESLRLASPVGTWDIGHAPSSAAGPDLLGVVVGSEGCLGLITEATLRVRRLPTHRRYEAWILPGFDAGIAALRNMAQSGCTADVMRLSDAQETATTLLMSGPRGVLGKALDVYLRRRGVEVQGAALAILGWEGVDRDLVNARRASGVRLLRDAGAVALGRRPGEAWQRHRFEGPHLRDALLDAGYLVETVETSTNWARLAELRAHMHEALRDSLHDSRHGPSQGTPQRASQESPGAGRHGPYVMTHVSHVYETGASLYTTVIAVADQQDPLGQWQRAKAAVTEAIMAHGGTLTHHHAVGRDHAAWLGREIGAPGLAVLHAAKAALDPRGVCNPGVLGL